MSNLSYCRFRNTVSDLIDCEENLFDELDDNSEIRARERIIKVCHSIAQQCSIEEIKNLPKEK